MNYQLFCTILFILKEFVLRFFSSFPWGLYQIFHFSHASLIVVLQAQSHILLKIQKWFLKCKYRT